MAKCHNNTKKSDLKPEKEDEYRMILAAEVHFYSQLQDRLSSGEFISVSDAQIDYEQIMILHNNHIRISRHLLKEKNQTHIANVDFTRPENPSSPTLIHSVATAKESILETAKRDDTEELTAIIKCAKIIRRAIEESDSWGFNGLIINQDKAIPNELLWMLKWIIQGDTAILTESRSREIHVTSENLTQMIIQAHKTNRQIKHKVPSCTSLFRSRIETPLTLGLSLHIHHATRRKQVLEQV